MFYNYLEILTRMKYYRLTAYKILEKAIGTKYENIKSLGKHLGKISSCACIKDASRQLCVPETSASHFNKALPISKRVESYKG